MFKELGLIESELGEDVMEGGVGAAQLIDGRETRRISQIRSRPRRFIPTA